MIWCRVSPSLHGELDTHLQRHTPELVILSMRPMCLNLDIRQGKLQASVCYSEQISEFNSKFFV